MKIISEPLKIGARDLIKGVEYSHYGVLYVYSEKRTFGDPSWKQRYTILSQGCFYIYKNKNSKKPKESYSLKPFEYVGESEPEKGENICFCLHNRNGKPKLFACDTRDTREEWIKKLRSELSDVQSTPYLSADSGLGSAGSVPTFRESDTYETEELDEAGRKYDKVDERLFSKPFREDKKDTEAQGSVKQELHSDDIDYEPVNCPLERVVCKGVNDIVNQGSSDVGEYGKDTRTNTFLMRRGSLTSVASSFVSVNEGDDATDNAFSSSSQPVVQPQGTIDGKVQQNVPHRVNYENIEGVCPFTVCKTETGIEQANKGLAGDVEKPTLETKQNSLIDETSLKLRTDHNDLAVGSVSSVPCEELSHVSVRDGVDCVSTEDPSPNLLVRGQESLIANGNDDGNSSDSGNTSPVTTYETPEIPESQEPFKFKRKDYICHGKGKARRELKQKPVGVFAVFPGESAELGLCVVTSHGLKYFRIHSHNERVSLYESNQSLTFSSLDDLLTFYHKNELPRKEYSVKLQKGYNTMC